MNELKAVRLKFRSLCPRVASKIDDDFDEAFCSLMDFYGVPLAVNKVLDIIEEHMDFYEIQSKE